MDEKGTTIKPSDWPSVRELEILIDLAKWPTDPGPGDPAPPLKQVLSIAKYYERLAHVRESALIYAHALMRDQLAANKGKIKAPDNETLIAVCRLVVEAVELGTFDETPGAAEFDDTPRRREREFFATCPRPLDHPENKKDKGEPLA